MKFKVNKSKNCEGCKYLHGKMVDNHGEITAYCCGLDNLQNEVEIIKGKCPNRKEK